MCCAVTVDCGYNTLAVSVQHAGAAAAVLKTLFIKWGKLMLIMLLYTAC